MSCVIPKNQPIYQALLDKAASYPADKIYQVKAYKKAAESVLTYDKNIYDEFATYNSFLSPPTNIGNKIEYFIYEFIKANPMIDPTPAFAAPNVYWSLEPMEDTERKLAAKKAMDDASMFAAQNAPKNTGWPDDSAERAAFQASVAATKTDGEKPFVQKLYTPENPRRSKRLMNKPLVQYYSPEEEYMDVCDALEGLCKKMGLIFTASLVTEFYEFKKTYDPSYFADDYIPDVAVEWAKFDSTSLKKQRNDKRVMREIQNYCYKNNIQFEPIMKEKYTTWVSDPANEKYLRRAYTYCGCSSCVYRNGNKPLTGFYEVSAFQRVKAFFSTLKKQIVW